MHLVILGGSGAATPEVAEGLAAWPGGVDRRPALELILVSRSADKLASVVAETRRRTADLPGAPVTVAGSTDRRAALRGADVVVNAVRIGGLAARVFDETFPQALGVPGEETMGPGGFANALRTVPALADTWRDIADVAPHALIINLTNPSGIVVMAAERQSGLRVISMCDSPATLCERIAERLGTPVGRVRARCLGMNHVGWWVPASPDELEATVDLAIGQDRDAVLAMGAIGGPYLRYYLDPVGVLATQLTASQVRAQQLQELETAMLTGYAAGAQGLPRRGAAWYPKAVLPLVDAWVNGTDEPLTVGLRNDGRIPGLPDDVMTEGPVVVRTPGIATPLAVPVLPTGAADLLAQHAAFEALTVEALTAGGGREDLVRALTANPMVDSEERAVLLVDAILAGSPG